MFLFNRPPSSTTTAAATSSASSGGLSSISSAEQMKNIIINEIEESLLGNKNNNLHRAKGNQVIFLDRLIELTLSRVVWITIREGENIMIEILQLVGMQSKKL
jgi:hypothetical protein